MPAIGAVHYEDGKEVYDNGNAETTTLHNQLGRRAGGDGYCDGGSRVGDDDVYTENALSPRRHRGHESGRGVAHNQRGADADGWP